MAKSPRIQESSPLLLQGISDDVIKYTGDILIETPGLSYGELRTRVYQKKGTQLAFGDLKKIWDHYEQTIVSQNENLVEALWNLKNQDQKITNSQVSIKLEREHGISANGGSINRIWETVLKHKGLPLPSPQPRGTRKRRRAPPADPTKQKTKIARGIKVQPDNTQLKTSLDTTANMPHESRASALPSSVASLPLTQPITPVPSHHLMFSFFHKTPVPNLPNVPIVAAGAEKACAEVLALVTGATDIQNTNQSGCNRITKQTGQGDNSLKNLLNPS